MLFSQKHARIKIDSCDSMPLKKTLTSYVIILMSVFDKNQNHYYYYRNVFLGKCSHHLAKK